MVSTRALFRAACGFAAAALVIGITPSAVNDARLPAWRGAMHWASTTATGMLRVATRHFAGFGGLPELLVRPEPEAASVVAEAPEAVLVGPPTSADVVRKLGLDPSGLLEALGRYQAGDLAGGDTAAAQAKDPIVKVTLEWAALRSFPARSIGIARLRAFAAAHPDWPAATWLHHRIEDAGVAEPPAQQKVFFAAAPPETILGKLAYARLLEADGRTAETAAIVKTLWREQDLAGGLEAKVKTDFGHYLDRADDKYRADRLVSKEESEAALRAAALAGPDVLALARLRVAMIHETATDKMFAAVPAALQTDPAYLLARIQKLRRANKPREAAALMQGAPRDPKLLINGDEWWVERRLIARKLLDLGDAAAAYDLCAAHSAVSPESQVEAEFHAGWIALRFMNDPARAAPHFARLARLASGPMSTARAAYWQGRTAEATLAPDADTAARTFYQAAAALPFTYYGQIARVRLGLPAATAAPRLEPAAGEARAEVVRVIELLYALGERELAVPLSMDAAQHLDGGAQAAALAEVVARERDAHLSLSVGKALNKRGIAIEALAYPDYGIPGYEPLPNSAPRALVYAVARQESGFEPKAVSGAGALGLMQMMAPTARHTADRAGIAFDVGRLVGDGALNAQLGAAHLGELLAEQKGSFILVLVAYNAGGKRVKEWIDAYGDPRSPGVDPIDWVERIPFTETRNYVQRCLENLTIYQSAFGDPPAAGREGDPRHQARL